MPFSISLYTYSILNELLDMGVECHTYCTYDELDGQEVDLIWHPLLSGLWTPDVELYSRTEPVVATLHGVRPFIFDEEKILPPEQAEVLRGIKKNVKEAWSSFRDRMTYMIAVSYNAKKEISDIYSVDPDKIEVVYHGVDHEVFKPAVTKQQRKRRPYLLTVAQYQPVKNVDRIVEAFLAADISEEYTLYMHLPNYTNPYVNDRIIVSSDPLTEPELAELYQGAAAFVFPSFHESFGLPVLEAMACGCPVITSIQTGTEEVCGQAAIIVDPSATSEIQQAMEKVINHPEIAHNMKLKGLKRAEMFHWHDAARYHLEVFKRALA